jgi:hypothetical protein
MKRIDRLTESDLTRIVRRVIMEQENTGTFSTLEIEWKRLKKAVQSGSSEWTSKGESLSKDLDKSIEALKKKGTDKEKTMKIQITEKAKKECQNKGNELVLGER